MSTSDPLYTIVISYSESGSMDDGPTEHETELDMKAPLDIAKENLIRLREHHQLFDDHTALISIGASHEKIQKDVRWAAKQPWFTGKLLESPTGEAYMTGSPLDPAYNIYLLGPDREQVAHRTHYNGHGCWVHSMQVTQVKTPDTADDGMRYEP